MVEPEASYVWSSLLLCKTEIIGVTRIDNASGEVMDYWIAQWGFHSQFWCHFPKHVIGLVMQSMYIKNAFLCVQKISQNTSTSMHWN